MSEAQFITKDVFDIHVKNLRDRADSEEKLSDARFDRLEALMAKNLAEQKDLVKDIRIEISAVGDRVDRIEKNIDRMGKDIDRLNERIEGIKENIGEARGEVKAVGARLDAHETKFGWYLAAFGLIITVVVAAIQYMK